jgi:tRNA-Thr(GGU) m(6)t(6)A37 methyltransferase TsaA
MDERIMLEPIGTVRTPYDPDFTPNQPVERQESESRLELRPDYEQALSDLEGFRYVYVLFYMHARDREVSPLVKPPWARGRKVGLFASRSPARPNPIGLSVVRLKRIEGCTVVTTSIDAYDGSPLLDIKPYIRGLDSKDDADVGWIADVEGGGEHLMEHVRGVPHEHDDDHHHHDH